MKPNVIKIVDAASGDEADILASLGFNCFGWRPVLAEGPREMLWSAPNFAEGGEHPTGSGIPLLFPFPGRLGGTQYTFAGREYQLEAGDKRGNAIHGFVFNRPWRVIEQQAHRVVAEFQASVDAPTILSRWPSDFRIRVAYEVRRRQLVADIEYDNPGDSPLPCGFATHAYFRLPLSDPGTVAETIVTVPAAERWETRDMLPTGQRQALEEFADLPTGLRLAEHQFDTCFTGLQADADRLVRTRLVDPSSGRSVVQTFDQTFGECVVYTPPHREAICMEPYTCVPDSFRLAATGHDTGLRILQPAESVATTITLAVAEPRE